VPFNCLALNVMLSGPGDVSVPIETIENVLYDWNRERATSSSIVLLPRHWSTDGVSSFSLGADGQAEINNQLVEQADIIFSVFHARIGSATARSVSGTAEEIDKAIERGIRVHVFFSTAAIPHSHDADQFAALKRFKASLGARGLYREFLTDDDLRGLVRQSLEADIVAFNSADQVSTSRDGVRLISRYEYRDVVETDSSGRVQTRKHSQRIVIRNEGGATASDVTLRFDPVSDGSVPILLTQDQSAAHFAAMDPESEVSVPIALPWGTASNQRATLTWFEGGTRKSRTQTLTF
jgi:hypothetical protein